MRNMHYLKIIRQQNYEQKDGPDLLWSMRHTKRNKA